MPKTYKASLTFVVLQEEGQFNLTSIIGELPFNFGGGQVNEITKYIAFLSSRRIYDKIIDRFNLWEVYKAKYIENLYRQLSGNVEFIDNFNGTVTINCYYKQYPEKAAEMAQMFYDELYKLVLELNKQESRNFKLYVEENFNKAQEKLRQLEDSLQVFQLNTKLIEFDIQSKLSFEVVADLEAKKQEYKLQMDYLKNYGTSDNTLLKEYQQKYNTIENNINNLILNGENYILALDNLPEKGLEYFRLYRDIQIQQKIVEILLPMLENARMEEQKKTANLQLLDSPYVPQYKSKPKRLTYMIIITFITFVIEIFSFTILDTYKNNKNEIKKWLNN